jgi:hypothetical protein
MMVCRAISMRGHAPCFEGAEIPCVHFSWKSLPNLPKGKLFQAIRSETISRLLFPRRDERDGGNKTCWLVLPFGAENDGMTVHASMTADGTKLPLMLIAHGKTNIMEDNQIGDIGGHWRLHAEDRRQTQTSFIRSPPFAGPYWRRGLLGGLHFSDDGLP